MAVFQLGAIVTKIKGSIGGTAFKTQRATNVMFRKSNGYSRSKLLNNQALQYARYIFTRWGYLSPEVQSGWQNMASIIFFPDKFGNQVHINGRQLYTKTNINLKRVDYFESISPTFSTVIPVLDVEDGSINPDTKYLTLGVEYFDNATAYVEVSAQVSVNNLQSPVYNRRETLIFQLVTGAGLLDFGDAFFSKFPYVTNGYNVRLYVTPVNIYGIKGTPIAVPVNFINVTPIFAPASYVTPVNWSSFVNLNSNLPQGHIIDMWYQSGPASMPEPDFDVALPLPAHGISNIDTVTLSVDWILLPAGLRYGNFVRLWLKPRDYNGTVFEPVSVIWTSKPEPLYMFNPFAISVNPDYSISATLENNFPVGTVIRVTVQNGGASFPNPALLNGTVAGDYELGLGGVVEIPSLLDNPAIDVEIGNHIVVLFEPYLDNFPIDTGLPLEVVYTAVSTGYDITNCVVTVTDPLTGSVNYNIFNNLENVVIPASGDIVINVSFDGWNSGDPLPDHEAILVDIEGLGIVPVVSRYPFAGWTEFNKSIVFYRELNESDVTSTMIMNSQVIPSV